MATVSDHLITKMSLDSKDYQQGIKQIGDSTRSLMGIVGGLGKTALFGGGAFGGGLIAMAGYAVKTAMSFDVMQRSLVTVTGSMQRAAQVMKFAQDLAGPSAFFGAEDLGKAAAMLETFSLTTERFLPLASTMASLFGQNTESLMSFVYALGRIKAGSFGEGFERMREFGIDAMSLKAQGLQFSKSNEYLGSVDQALTGIETVIKQKFGNLDRMMQDSPMAKWTSLLDALQRMAKNAGDSLLKYVAPVIDRIQAGISNIVSNNDLGKSIDNLFKGFNPDKFGDAILYGIASIIAAIKQIPNIVKGAFGSFYSAANGVKGVLTAIRVTLNLIVGVAVIKGIVALVQAYKVLATAIKATATAQAVLTAMTPGGLALVAAGVGAGIGIYWWLTSEINKAFDDKKTKAIGGFSPSRYASDRDQIYGAMTGGQRLLGLFDPINKRNGESSVQSPGTASPATGYLREIAQNTKKEVEISRMILGGGNMGALGATAVELQGVRGRSPKWNKAFQAIQDAVLDDSSMLMRARRRMDLAMS